MNHYSGSDNSQIEGGNALVQEEDVVTNVDGCAESEDDHVDILISNAQIEDDEEDVTPPRKAGRSS